jgi:hypothetical protein
MYLTLLVFEKKLQNNLLLCYPNIAATPKIQYFKPTKMLGQ